MSTHKLLRLYLRWGLSENNYEYNTSYYTFLTTMSDIELDYYSTRHYIARNANIDNDVQLKVLNDFPFNDIANVSRNIACASNFEENPVLTRLVNFMGEISIPWTYEIDANTINGNSIYFQVSIDENFDNIIQSGRYSTGGGSGIPPIRLIQMESGSGYRTDIKIPVYVYNETNDTIKYSTIYAYTFNNNATAREAAIDSISKTSNYDALRPLIDLPPYIPPIPDNDPYKDGGNTDTGGGTGNFDGTSDSIDFPNLPSLSAVDTGFITLFNPSASQLKSLANYMWSGLFDLDTFKKIFADPMDCILGLSIVPVNVPSGSSDTVKVGNISTGVSMTKAASQYVSVDCGTLNVNEFWGAYLDYSPYTKAEIYLPYVGTHPLDIDDIMNKPVHVKYHIDILSGACIAFVKCGDSVLYSFIGQCSSSIPITGNDWTNVINGVINIAGAVGSMVMTGGMSAPMAIGQIASTAVNSSKPSVEKSGSLSGTGGMLGVQTPYMILTRPRQALPAQQNVYTGYPSFITRTLSSVSGYTEVDHIHLENVPGTESELSEIESLLKTGVIF